MSIREDLLRGQEANALLEAVHACLLSTDRDRSALASELVALHNEGLIDVVAAFESLENTSSTGPDFFLTRHVFEEALPNLDALVPSVMRCVLALYRGAGQDLAAGTIVRSFIDYCGGNPSRPREALAAIEASPDTLADLLPGTLVAGSRVDSLFHSEAIRLCQSSNLQLRRNAVFSLGRLEWSGNGVAVDVALAAMERCVGTEADDQVLAAVVKSASALVGQHEAFKPRFVAVISTALSKGGELAIHAGSEVFSFHTGELGNALLDTLLEHLAHVKPANAGTLENIDFGLAHLLDSDPEKAIRFLEDLLLMHPDDLTMEAFDGAGRVILTSPSLINRVVTRWFLRGDLVLGSAVHTIFASNVVDNVPLEIDPAELRPADFVHIIFVARKAIGHLFTYPISAASLLLSLMRHTAESKVLSGLEALLFDPLLLNYTGKARDYVARQAEMESGDVKAALDRALQQIDDYLENLSSVGSLPALHPGVAQREAYHRHSSRQMEGIWKAAEEKSILLSLVSKSVVLYGRKSVAYVRGVDEQSRRMEFPMQSHETEVEIPRMLRLDPTGLDFRLRVFRVEQIAT